MPAFLHKNKLYYNPVEFVLDCIGGTYKMPILWRLRNKSMRYSELKNDIEHVSDRMLSLKLKELEADGFISRKVYAEVPPRVEYSLTKRGKHAIKIVDKIRKYGLELMEDFEIDTGKNRKK